LCLRMGAKASGCAGIFRMMSKKRTLHSFLRLIDCNQPVLNPKEAL
jgi:hypothetical protein